MDEDRLFELLEGYVEATLDEPGRKDLETLLASSPRARQVFTEYLAQHALLRKLVVQAGARRMVRRERRASWRRPAAWIAAACAAGALAAFLWIPRPSPDPEPGLAAGPVAPSPEPPPPPPPPAPDPVPPVAPPPPSPEETPPSPPVPAPPPLPPARPPEVPPAPPPPPPREDPVPPRPEPPRRTVAIVGRLEKVAGEAFVATASGRTRAAERQEISAGDRLETPGPESLIWVRCADGTRLELGPQTSVREEHEETGRRIVLDRGLLVAEVARQPAASPLLIETPQAETRTPGARLMLCVTPDRERVEVRDGRVRLSRKSEKGPVDVAADSHVVVARGAPLAAKPSRIHDGLVALWRFDGGPGDLVRDLSGAGAPLDLEIHGARNIAWSPDGLVLKSWGQIGTAHGARKVAEACRKSREITLEAWVVPAKPSLPHESVLIAMWDHPARNFSLSQAAGTPGAYAATLRTSATDAAARPVLVAPKGTVEPRLAHVVYSRAANGVERLVVNGVPRAASVRGGDFSTWSDSFRLVVGVEWLGEIRLAAVYGRALKDPEVARNFKVGTD